MKFIYIGTLLMALIGCSYIKKSEFIPPLKTTIQNDQYFYCEDCPLPTNLKVKRYYILEPDTQILNNDNLP